MKIAITKQKMKGGDNMLVSAEEVKEILGSPEIDNPTIDRMIARKQAVMEKYIERKIEEEEYTEYYNTDKGVDSLNLRNYPVTDFTGMWRVTTSGVTVFDSNYYYVEEDRGIISLLAGITFIGGMKSIKVQYKAGYVAADIPLDLKDACIDLVCAQFVFSKVMVNEIETDHAGDRKKALEDSAFKILDLYKGISE